MYSQSNNLQIILLVFLLQQPAGSSYLLCGDESGSVTILHFPTPTIRLFTGVDTSSRPARITLQVGSPTNTLSSLHNNRTSWRGDHQSVRFYLVFMMTGYSRSSTSHTITHSYHVQLVVITLWSSVILTRRRNPMCLT